MTGAQIYYGLLCIGGVLLLVDTLARMWAQVDADRDNWRKGWSDDRR